MTRNVLIIVWSNRHLRSYSIFWLALFCCSSICFRPVWNVEKVKRCLFLLNKIWKIVAHRLFTPLRYSKASSYKYKLNMTVTCLDHFINNALPPSWLLLGLLLTVASRVFYLLFKNIYVWGRFKRFLDHFASLMVKFDRNETRTRS